MTMKNVLVVDDDPINRQVVSEYLGNLEGVHIDVAETGLAAIRLLSDSCKYDFVFLDISLPEVSGYDVSSFIRKNHQERDVKIYAMTGFDEKEISIACRNAGIDAILTKPLNHKIIIDAVRQLGAFGKKNSASIPTEVNSAACLAPDISRTIQYPNHLARADSRYCGEGELFSRLQADFLKIYSPTLGCVREAIEKQRYEDVKRICHRIKGSAAVIGAVGIVEAIENIESSLELPSLSAGDVSALLGALEHAFANIAATAESTGAANYLQKKTDSTDSAPSEDINVATTKVGKLIDALERRDGNVDSYFALCRPFLKLWLSEKSFSRLEEAIDAYDFEIAKQYIHQAFVSTDLSAMIRRGSAE